MSRKQGKDSQENRQPRPPPKSKVRKVGEIEMRPFEYSAAGQNYALELADGISSHEPDHEPNNIAAALLIAGIAAIEDQGDREICAYFVIRRIMSHCPSVESEMNELMTANHGEFILCTQ
jgi:hypothetical protein